MASTAWLLYEDLIASARTRQSRFIRITDSPILGTRSGRRGIRTLGGDTTLA